MKSTLSLSALVALVILVPFAQAVSEWGQCDGTNYTGSKSCDAGLTCVYFNEWYSQCQKVSTSSSSPPFSTSQPPPASTCVCSPVSTTSTTTSSTRIPSSTSTANGFVKVDGQKFKVDGVTFNAVGTNAYWLAQLGSSSLIQSAFSEIASSGATVVRTWGFNDVTSPSGTYYQLWSGSTPTINYGADGLQKFDQVVAAAKAAGIRLVVPFTGNWGDYGGMDRYITQILGGGQAHSNFYTNSAIKTAYKNYVKAFVGRYVNEPTIMSWQLANEPRCNGCSTSIITNWATEMSAYVKSLDPNHLVSLGDEGFFNQPGNPSYPYQGGEGVDFAANMGISTLDYGTFHMYITPWGISDAQSWGVQWINDHASVQKSSNKPVIIEEYGLTSSDRNSVYQAWWNAVLSSGLAGDQYWQAATTASGSGYNDGYGISPSDSLFPAVKAHSAAMKARS
ncbi:hypothetical protein FRC20_004373 [Serendipita sp. 405]|nr:hypothetical protein FRC15_004469 [Serendipita sp. 397]KAG8842486.1 hypothetical protein FRC20_004373 [Serendipita sp. 405]